MRVGVVDHGMGNLRSVAKAIEAGGGDVSVTSDRSELAGMDALCVPGQGIFGRCMTNLESLDLEAFIREWLADDRRFLGICLGMQVLFESSEEPGSASGLAIFPGEATRLPPSVRVPHIGWNTVNDDYFYFDHSYAVHPADPGLVTGWAEHGDKFAARIDRGRLTAVQFHPEKSGTAGIRLLQDWLRRP